MEYDFLLFCTVQEHSMSACWNNVCLLNVIDLQRRRSERELYLERLKNAVFKIFRLRWWAWPNTNAAFGRRSAGPSKVTHCAHWSF